MNVYLGKQRKNAAGDVTATHGTVLQLVRRVEIKGHKIYMDSFFSSPRLFYDLRNRKIGSCGTVRHNRKDMPANFGPKQLKLKKGDVVSKVRDNLTAMLERQESGVHALKHTSSSSQWRIFKTSMGMPQNLTSSSNIMHTRGMWTKVTECQTPTAHVVGHGNGRKSCSSISWISLYSTPSCFTSLLAENCATKNSGWK
jgi:hypothetical protein